MNDRMEEGCRKEGRGESKQAVLVSPADQRLD